MTAGRPPGRPPTPRPGEGQDTLGGEVDDVVTLRGPLGPTAQAVADSVAASALAACDAAMSHLALELARAVDLAAAKADPRAIATAGRELREVLTRLGLDPSSRKGGGGDSDAADKALADFIRSLNDPQVGDPAHA